ncbi:MAG: AtpZ/AtpI family protein [Parcubacteria group bacterium]
MNNDEQKIPWWEPGMVMFARLSGWIAGPVIVAVFVGRWLDKKYDTAPWIFLASVGVAFVISSMGIVKEAKAMMNKIIEDEKKKKNGGKQ